MLFLHKFNLSLDSYQYIQGRIVESWNSIKDAKETKKKYPRIYKNWISPFLKSLDAQSKKDLRDYQNDTECNDGEFGIYLEYWNY
jgi:hypothetical protein